MLVLSGGVQVPNLSDVIHHMVQREVAQNQVLSFLEPRWPHLDLSVLVRSACS
jgi:hypothetical protein